MTARIFLLLMMWLTMVGCTQKSPTVAASVGKEEKGDGIMFQLASPAFSAGDAIPAKYSCKGDDISPPLSWSGTPNGTQSLALIFDDPDAPAGTWVHWVVFNLPAETTELAENAALPAVAHTGANSWGKTSYGGPCPPSGTHRYFFKLYAVDTQLSLAAGATKADVLSAMAGHILAQTELMGTFSR